MKKVFTLLSALAFTSASQSEGFLSDNELSIIPLPPHRPGTPFMFYADDEQYNRDQLESFRRNHPEKPSNSVPVTQIQKKNNAHDSSLENSLFELKQIMKQRGKVQNQEKFKKSKLEPALDNAYHVQPSFDLKPRPWIDPSKIKHQHQPRSTFE